MQTGSDRPQQFSSAGDFSLSQEVADGKIRVQLASVLSILYHSTSRGLDRWDVFPARPWSFLFMSMSVPLLWRGTWMQAYVHVLL
jgi:hypothetical protein